MRYLPLFGLLLVLIACNNRSSVTAETREPVYYDENTAIDVPQPVENTQPEVIENQVPALRGKAAYTQRRIPEAKYDARDKAVLLREPQTLDGSGKDRLVVRKKTPPAKVNQEALRSGPATKTQQGATAPQEANPNGKVEPVREPSRTIIAPPTPAPTVAEQTPPTTEALIAYPTHEAFDVLLKRYVDATGKVDYAGLKSRATALDKYLNQLENNAPDASWPRDEAMAFWINAYNAYTLKLIVDNYPVASIKDLKGGNPWDVKWINIGGKSLSLNNIEHDILRKDFFDPRIHAVVNCAAASCPPLWNRAFTAGNLDKGLQTRTTAWINNPAYNKVSESSLQLSKLFDWYGQDFGDKVEFVNEYFRGDEISDNAKVTYLDYDWSLNKQ